MRKTWVALAVLGAFAGVAQAQSSVTLYGIVDVNVQLYDPANDSSTVRVTSGHQSGSRWGMRGSEDLGGGMKGIFTLEGGYDTDTGQQGQGGRIFGRQAWAGLETGMGSFVLGRLASLGSGTGSWDMFGRVDPFGTGFGGLNLVFSVANAQRFDNGMMWRSPKWGGFQFGVEHSRRTDGSEVPGNAKNRYMTGGAASWEGGPFFAAITYNVTNNETGGSDQKNLQIGGTFDLGMFRLHAGYAKEDNNFAFNTAGINDGADADAWMIGASMKWGSSSLMGSYNKYDGDKNGSTGAEKDFDRFGIAYTYSLSRRTNLYVSAGFNNGKKALENTSRDFNQYTAGLRHLF